MLEKLKNLIKEVMPDVDVNNVNAETRLVEDLHFDSLGIMMLAMNLEEAFGVHFDGPVNFVTVQDVIDYLEKNSK